jgi:hypothetical protein
MAAADVQTVYPNLRQLIDHIDNEYQHAILNKLLTRAEEDKIYLSGYEPNVDPKKKDVIGTIKVWGSIRKGAREAYDVKIYKNNPDKGTLYCSCADCKFNGTKKSSSCKHISFVITRILKLFDVNFFLTKQLTEEQVAILISKLTTDTILKDTDLTKISKTVSLADYKNFTKDVSGLDCSICCMSLEEDREQNNVACITCKNEIHLECISVWLERPENKCIYCRSDSWKYLNKVKNGNTLNLL